MKLKEIEPGMIIHCKVEEEADVLLEFLDTLGYCWVTGNSLLTENNYRINKDYTCYYLNKNKTITYGTFDYYRDVLGGTITNFTELEISRKLYQTELNAKEVLEWVAECYYSNVWKELFEKDDSIDVLINRLGADEVIRRITQWKKENENNRPEPKFEWVDICRIIEVHKTGKKECVYEEQLAAGNTAGEEKILVETILKKYVLEHEGNFFAKVEHLCRVAEDK